MIAAAHDDRGAVYATPPALLAAGDDPALDPISARVLLWLHRILDFDRFGPVKASGAPPSLRTRRGRMKRETIGRALRLLVDGGYLEPGPRDGATPTYRLRHLRTEGKR